MDRSTLRATTQLAFTPTPISLAELREFILRHLLSDPHNHDKQATTQFLLGAYLDMAGRGVTTIRTGMDLAVLYGRHYQDGFKSAFETREFHSVSSMVPAILPRGLPQYPCDIIEQFATTMGFTDAAESRIEN